MCGSDDYLCTLDFSLGSIRVPVRSMITNLSEFHRRSTIYRWSVVNSPILYDVSVL